MKREKLTLVFLALAALFFSCSKEVEEEMTVASGGAVQTKVVRLSEQVDCQSFLVKFAAVPTAEELASLCPGAAVKPLFKSFPGKEALEAQFGLDRWYEISLPEGSDLAAKVSGVAGISNVEMVEYISTASLEGEDVIYPADAPVVTKSTSDGFNDPYLVNQWHYNNQGSAAVSPSVYKGADINVKDVWSQLCCGDPSIIVAVVDQGVKHTHPDLKANMWVNSGEIPGDGIDNDGNGYVDDVYGYNFVDDTATITWSNSGHGTHCAGTIAAVNNNNIGVAGVAGGSGNNDGCKIMSCQIFSASGGGSAVQTANAVKYAADMGASVISCSFGYSYPFISDSSYISSQGSVEIDAIHYFEQSASNNGVITDGNIAIFAAGNEGQDFAHYPGAFYDIISVSALGPDFLPTYYTNYGPGCNIAAPGGEAYHLSGKWNSMVLSTVPTEVGSSGMNGEYQKTGLEYGYMQGTSMACPHVSGVVALALSYAKSRGKTFTRDEFKRMILASTKDIDQRIGKTTAKSYAYYQSDLTMAPYYHQMGTGAIDAWRLMMHIDGIPCSTATVGKKQWISLDNLFGTASVSLTYLAVDVPQETVSALGLQKISGTNGDKYPITPEGEVYAYVQFGRLYIHPTKMGSGKISITAIGGGDHLGGGSNPPGGMELTEQISIMAREVDGGNGTGGWL